MRPTLPKAGLPLLFAIVLLTRGALPIHAQSALDGFDPNANGAIQTIVVQPDGKILIGGAFTTLAPNGGASVTRNRIARLNADGSLDSAFNPNASNTIWSIALQADGKILAGGDFTSIGGQTRNRVARLDPVTGLADSFDPNANNTVRAIATQSDGKVLTGGFFTSIGGQTRNRVARLDAVTGPADSFNPNVDNFVASIAVQPDGKVLVSGFFTSIGGQTRNSIGRLDPVTGLADSFNPNASSAIFSLALQADGKILAGGLFTTIGGQTRNHIARLDAATGAADSFNPNANDNVYSIVVQGDGKILVGGIFAGTGTTSTIGHAARNRIARLDPATGLADSFDPNANNDVTAIAVQPDGKILIGGFVTAFTPNGGAATTRNRVARLEIDGRVDQTLGLTNAASVFVTAGLADGKTLIGGSFTNLQGTGTAYLARLNTDGTIDFGFAPFSNGSVRQIALQTDGKILVGGDFSAIGSQARHRLARLISTGFADSFDAQLDTGASINSLAVQPDGRILVGGTFSTIGGQTRNNIGRLDSSTALADSFNPNANGSTYAITMQADGKILVGGNFTVIGGQTRNRIARLDPSTGLADAFNPNANNFVDEFAVQPDGKILVGGNFTNIGGQNRKNIARLDPVTGLVDSFDPDEENMVASTIALQADGKILVNGYFSDPFHTHFYSQIRRLDPATGVPDSFYRQFETNAGGGFYAITLQTDGKILAGGYFADLSLSSNGFFRLTNDTAAQQNLAATQSSVTWTRGGSSPQFGRVTFEVSTDNVNYSLLGAATPSGSNWTLNGLALPTQQNLYIRARGRSAISDSDSITESVQNIFLTLTQTPTPIPTSTPAPSPTPTATPSVTASPTPTPTPATINISGVVAYCSNPALPPVPGTILTITGNTSGVTSSDGSGNYTLSSIPSGGNYAVTPNKTALAPGAAGISTIDIVAIQRQFLNLGTPLSGCRLTAADVNGDASVTTIDVVATQRFFLGFSTGTSNVGKYQFNPASRSYSGVITNQTGQNYDAIVFGDVASAFVH